MGSNDAFLRLVSDTRQLLADKGEPTATTGEVARALDSVRAANPTEAEQVQAEIDALAGGHDDVDALRERLPTRRPSPSAPIRTLIWFAVVQWWRRLRRCDDEQPTQPTLPKALPPVAVAPIQRPNTKSVADRALLAVKGEDFDHGRIDALRFALDGSPITSADAKRILEVFDFDRGRVQALTVMRDHISDPSEWFVMMEVFDFDSARREARALRPSQPSTDIRTGMRIGKRFD